MNISFPASNHDPATAHSQILVSSGGRTAGHWESPLAAVPSGVECLGSLCCVLCRQGFVGAWHAWAVKAHPGPDWALEVSWEFVSQMWGLGCGAALAWLSPTSLPHSHTLQGIEVALDYAGGRWLSMMLVARLKSLSFSWPLLQARSTLPAALAGQGASSANPLSLSPPKIHYEPPKCRHFHHLNKHSTSTTNSPTLPTSSVSFSL